MPIEITFPTTIPTRDRLGAIYQRAITVAATVDVENDVTTLVSVEDEDGEPVRLDAIEAKDIREVAWERACEQEVGAGRMCGDCCETSDRCSCPLAALTGTEAA